MRSTSRSARSLGLIGLVVWTVAPFAVIALAAQHDSSRPLRDTATPSVTVQASVGGAVDELSVALHWTPAAELSAPAWSGTVQHVGVAAGDTVRNGDVVMRIDGVDRLAAATVEPFWRPIRVLDAGSDVAAFNAWLGSLGLEHGSGAEVDPATVRGAVSLARRIGAPVPDGTVQPLLDPSWVVYLPGGEFEVAAVATRPAQPAPGQGSAIATGRRRLASAVPNASAPVVESTDHDAVPDPAATEVLSGWEVPAGEQVFADEGLTRPLELSADRRSFATSALPLLEEDRGPDTTSATVFVVRPPIEGEMQVSASAVTVGGGDATCLRRVDGLVVPIRVVDQGAGVVAFTAGGRLSVGDRVADAPPNARGCPT